MQFFVHVNPFPAQDSLLDHCVAADRTERIQDWNLLGVVWCGTVGGRLMHLSVNFEERGNRPNMSNISLPFFIDCL